jgi:hypothetical protein
VYKRGAVFWTSVLDPWNNLYTKEGAIPGYSSLLETSCAHKPSDFQHLSCLIIFNLLVQILGNRVAPWAHQKGKTYLSDDMIKGVSAICLSKNILVSLLGSIQQLMNGTVKTELVAASDVVRKGIHK